MDKDDLNDLWRIVSTDRRTWGVSLFACAFCILLSLATFLERRIAAWIFFSITSIVLAYCTKRIHSGVIRAEKERLAKYRDDTLRTRKERGLMNRSPNDVVVSEVDWGSPIRKDDWVEGEPQIILVGDKVIRWNHGAWGGLAIERNGKIVAVRQQWHMELALSNIESLKS
jgi:hypothetical protein